MVSSPESWLLEFALVGRRPPELFLAGDEVAGSPHAGALRISLGEMGLAAVLCVSDVPTVGFLVGDGILNAEIDRVHRALWNQGLMGLLVVVDRDRIRAYSLSKLPVDGGLGDGEDGRLVVTLGRVVDALKVRDIVMSVESGRWWLDHAQYHAPDERVDRVLLSNMMASYTALKEQGLGTVAAQAILMQVMFIAYLEDRGIATDSYFRKATHGCFDSLASVLASGQHSALDELFVALKGHFNGGLFIAPCAFEPDANAPSLNMEHMKILARFRAGVEDMELRQFRFWGYNFRYIPVELLSSVYDRFLGENEKERRADGAYYTPMFLADMVVTQAWDAMAPAQRDEAVIRDPACGSGIFLVRAFQRLVEHKRIVVGRSLEWQELIAIAERVRGADINPSALRVAAFSLYIALLEQITPPDIMALMNEGHMLPVLHNKTLIKRSFFEQVIESDATPYEILIGNPPWASRRGDPGGGLAWCSERGLPCPSDEIAWAFVWKAVTDQRHGGLTAFLLPAMALLHNHSHESVLARSRLFSEAKIQKIINFSDLAFLLFEGADRPAALMIFCKKMKDDDRRYVFDYWCPKADMNLMGRQIISLSSMDRNKIRSDAVITDGRILKRKLWARRPDEKLLKFLDELPKVSDLVDEYEKISRKRAVSRFGWVIGQGFQPASDVWLNDSSYPVRECQELTQYPHLETRSFKVLAQPTIRSRPWGSSYVRRVGFRDGFRGPHILIPQGVIRDEGRIRAAYTEQSLSFRHSIQAISFPESDRVRAKLLTAILNSKLAAWYAFHQTANLGTDRAKVHQEELLEIPFPQPEDLGDSVEARRVAGQICDLIDSAAEASDLPLLGPTISLDQVDALVYRYFGLTGAEIAVVEDTLDFIIPAMQPRETDVPNLWRPVGTNQRKAYGNALADSLQAWVEPSKSVSVDLVASSADLGVIAIKVLRDRKIEAYRETKSENIDELLATVWKILPAKMPGNFQMIPDLRIALGGTIYLFKPMAIRYWLRSAAQSDADELLADMHRSRRHHSADGTEAAE